MSDGINEIQIEQTMANAVGETISYFASQIKVLDQRNQQIESTLTRIEQLLAAKNADNATRSKDWYTPIEVSKILGKATYTIREWCRFQRIKARKRPSGRGDAEEWEISAEEIERYRNHGLLPVPKRD